MIFLSSLDLSSKMTFHLCCFHFFKSKKIDNLSQDSTIQIPTISANAQQPKIVISSPSTSRELSDDGEEFNTIEMFKPIKPTKSNRPVFKKSSMIQVRFCCSKMWKIPSFVSFFSGRKITARFGLLGRKIADKPAKSNLFD